MEEYTRPPCEDPRFYDDDGALIPYGQRWRGQDGPPEEAYSVMDHPERFAPLLSVATALATSLETRFAVQTEEGYHLIATHPHAPSEHVVTRTLRITPRDPCAAPITLVWTSQPSVWLFAGALFQASFPSCACNACDEHWADAATYLEEHVSMIITGDLTEGVSTPPRRRWRVLPGRRLTRGFGHSILYQLRAQDDGMKLGGRAGVADIPASLLTASQQTLQEVRARFPSGNWQPWEPA